MSCANTASSAKGYTLIELVVVVALLAIVATITFPRAQRSVRRAPIDKASYLLLEAFNVARLRSVCSGQICLVRIRSEDGLVEVVNEHSLAFTGSGLELGDGSQQKTTKRSLPTFRAFLPSEVAFRQLSVNGMDMMQEKEAFVAFYPNGTCDALLAVLIDIEGERRHLETDIVTGRLKIISSF